MLEELFSSRTRSKLLALFLENLGQSFFVREICRQINERIHSVRRELDNLEKFGLLISKVKDQKKYYQLNQDFPIINELKALFDKSKLLVERLIGQKVLKLEGLKYLALTGQFTLPSGQAGGAASISTDVLLVGKISRESLEKFISDLEKVYNKQIRYTYFTNQEFALRKDLTDKFLYSILNGKKVVLVNKLGI